MTTDPTKRVFHVEFGYSKSSSYSRALNLVRKHPTYSNTHTQHGVTHSVEYDTALGKDVIDLLRLVRMIGRLKSKAVRIDGSEALWSEAFRWRACYEARSQALVPDLYCFSGSWWGIIDDWSHGLNFWGCKHSKMGKNVGAYELTTGTFEGRHFTLDKQGLLNEVTAELQEYRHCPALSWAFVDNFIEHLPDSISAKTPRWRFVDAEYEHSEGDDCEEVIEQSIFRWRDWDGRDVHELRDDERAHWGRRDPRTARGVTPEDHYRTIEIFIGIYRRMAKELRRPAFEPEAKMSWITNLGSSGVPNGNISTYELWARHETEIESRKRPTTTEETDLEVERADSSGSDDTPQWRRQLEALESTGELKIAYIGDELVREDELD